MDPVIRLDGLEVRFGERVILNRLKAALTGRSIGLLGPTALANPPSSTRCWASTSRLRNRAHFRARHPHRRREVRSLVGYMPETTPSSPT